MKCKSKLIKFKLDAEQAGLEEINKLMSDGYMNINSGVIGDELFFVFVFCEMAGAVPSSDMLPDLGQL